MNVSKFGRVVLRVRRWARPWWRALRPHLRTTGRVICTVLALLGRALWWLCRVSVKLGFYVLFGVFAWLLTARIRRVD